MKQIKIGETLKLKAVRDKGLHPCLECYFFDADIDGCDLCTRIIDGCAHFELEDDK